MARDRAFTGAFALIVTATACAVVVLAAPRPVLPSQLPALRLAPEALAAQERADAALASRVPRGADVDALLRAYREEGLRERAAPPDAPADDAERQRVIALADPVFARIDRAAARALQLQVSTRALAALWGERAAADDARGLLGRFPELLARYGYVDAAGRLLAPELSVRALYMARFNLICGRGLLDDLTALEQSAHEGWMALQVGALDPELRAEAARRFRTLGGRDAAEAEAIWRFQGGDAAGASAQLAEAYARTGLLRLRNLSLGAASALSNPGTLPSASSGATTLSR